MKKYIIPTLIIIVGLLIFFAPFGYAAVCGPMKNGGMMKCHWSGECIRLLGGLVTALGICFLFCKKARFGLAIANIGIAISIFLIPTFVIGTCKMAKMPCNAYTKPTAILLSIILLVINIVYILLNRKDS